MSKLLYVAFFGGLLPMAILGTRNLIWLNVQRAWIYILGAAAAGLWAVRLVMVLYGGGTLGREGRWISRGMAVALYLGYRWAMSGPYRQHMVLHGGKTEPLLKDAAIVIFGTAVLEFLIAFFLLPAGTRL